jgi:hypothetical protein
LVGLDVDRVDELIHALREAAENGEAV